MHTQKVHSKFYQNSFWMFEEQLRLSLWDVFLAFAQTILYSNFILKKNYILFLDLHLSQEHKLQLINYVQGI
jgi:hypothetical protein